MVTDLSIRRRCQIAGSPMGRALCGLLAAVVASALAAQARGTDPSTPFANSPFREHARAAAAAATRHADAQHGNSICILNDGYEALLARVHLIRNASKTINIQTFIWTNDECGRLMMYELIEAARRGVIVRIIADHFVSEKDPGVTAFLATVHPNIAIKHYRPAASRIKPSKLQSLLSGAMFFRNTNQRMHNKIMTFDDVIAITGGRNIENTYFNFSAAMNFKDRDAVVCGPIVPRMVASFERFWAFEHSKPSTDLKDVRAAIARGDYPRFRTRQDFAMHGFFGELSRQADEQETIRAAFVHTLMPAKHVEFVADRPGKNRSWFLSGSGRATDRLVAAVRKTRTEFIMQSPYLILSGKAQKLFRKMREQRPGLRIRASTNSFASTDNVVAYSANYRLRSTYVEDLGFRIHEYKAHPGDLFRVFPQYTQQLKRAAEEAADGQAERPFLCIHAKSFVLDGETAFIGSYNMDPRSANLNTEVGLLIRDRAIAQALRADILNDMAPQNSWVIAKRRAPLGLDQVNALVADLMDLSPLDVWPVSNTTSFELNPGRKPVPPEHPDFYGNYTEAGSFPGARGGLSTKEITTRLYKVIGPTLTPIL